MERKVTAVARMVAAITHMVAAKARMVAAIAYMVKAIAYMVKAMARMVASRTQPWRRSSFYRWLRRIPPNPTETHHISTTSPTNPRSRRVFADISKNPLYRYQS